MTLGEHPLADLLTELGPEWFALYDPHRDLWVLISEGGMWVRIDAQSATHIPPLALLLALREARPGHHVIECTCHGSQDVSCRAIRVPLTAPVPA